VRKFPAVLVIEKPFAADMTGIYVTMWFVTVNGTGVPFGYKHSLRICTELPPIIALS
jgi:hypothetical protein